MNFVYAALWFVIAIILIVRFRREGALVWVASGLFVFMGAWWLVDAIIADIDLMDGVYAWVFRGVVLAFVLAGAGVYLVQKNRSGKQDENNGENK